jgi:hypothetical protein
MNSKPMNFIELLDKYKTVEKLDYNDSFVLLSAINRDFKNSKLNDTSYTGRKIPIDEDGFYSIFSTSSWNKSVLNLEDAEKTYEQWKQKHESVLNINIPKTKTHTIDKKVSNLSDLIHIIENNEYDEATQYNIINDYDYGYSNK